MFSKKTENENSEFSSEESISSEAVEGNENFESGTQTSSVSLKPSIISEGFEFTGDMKSGGSITVDGTFKGNLSVQTLLIGAGGFVDGTVTADSINVKGKLSGTVSCRDLVIGGRATVDGTLNYTSITIQRGGTIKGDLKRK
ncbi:polymer-forming cytoskeletal protein [Polynucleobacter sp. AM-26B4]|uniref:bactofilin family protein n=1 Tax=Polynucleobacter sp. AM-26B4 TaxID=2689103 RepID=UPI001C0ACE32|nr:polymer-forming cytoskeletal protein [Polynucleobacter sp. AM-26B4]MBU3585788.1 polymer-forming cytoskeletal protein [Polynucleobacter sp. AM-26B4]